MGTFGEAHELEHGNAGLGKQLARLGMTGGAVQLHLDDSVLDGHLSHKGALEVVGEGPIRVCMPQVTGVLLAAQGHLHRDIQSGGTWGGGGRGFWCPSPAQYLTIMTHTSRHSDRFNR